MYLQLLYGFYLESTTNVLASPSNHDTIIVKVRLKQLSSIRKG